MKYLIVSIMCVLLMLACKNTNGKQNEEESYATEEVSWSGDKEINLDESTIFWKGYKLIGNHTGKINLKSGALSFQNGNIVGGDFVVDMHSVAVTELMEDDDDEEEEEEDDDKSDLANHLMDADFFDAKSFSEAIFKIKKSTKNGNTYKITGDMTIKGITKEVTFDANLKNGSLQSDISVNRTDFGIKYGSGSFFENLGDNVIKDKFDLIVNLKVAK